MKKLYLKSELTFSLIWIIAYCVLMSVGDSLSQKLGVTKAVTLPVALVLSAVLFLFIKKNNLLPEYGFCKPRLSASEMLFYIPLLIILTVNLWHGVNFTLSFAETVLYILTMFCVGFLEEVIFRGLLFNAMRKNGIRSAIIVSSVTFGIGHIINLFNGSGADLIANILQVIYAIAAGFMFVMIYYKGGSLIPCIVTHSIFNGLSVFADESLLTLHRRIVSCVFLTVISLAYAGYLTLITKKQKDKEITGL